MRCDSLLHVGCVKYIIEQKHTRIGHSRSSSADVPCALAEAWTVVATVHTVQSTAAGTSEILSTYTIYTVHIWGGA